MKMKNTKGFTLIEMLVVIAIIGLLSSVVLVALGPSRNKAKDARIILNVNQVQVLMETVFTNGTYPAAAPTSIAPLVSDALSNGGTLVTSISADRTAFSASSNLVSGGFYCVDSTGKSYTGATTPTGTACP
jgi:prepilin-type N-terminal cleavage/methylation domain-containing protein